MNALKKIVRVLNSTLDISVLVVCIMLMLLGAYSFIDNAHLYSAAADRSVLYYKPELNEPIAEEKLITENQVAWIQIGGTGIDFPILQGKDNVEYLNKDPYGEFSFSGSIFLDSRNASDFSDGYSVIYGHHMSGGHMFGCLDSFTDEEYLRQHNSGTLTTKDKVYDVELFAVISCLATDRYVFGLEEKSFESINGYLIENAQLLFGQDVTDRIIALTTCTDEGGDARLVVCAYIKERTVTK